MEWGGGGEGVKGEGDGGGLKHKRLVRRGGGGEATGQWTEVGGVWVGG